MQALSLRTRLVAVAVTLVAFGVAALGVGTYLALRGYLISQIDDRLAAIAAGPTLGLAEALLGGPDQAPLPSVVIRSDGTLARLQTSYGDRLPMLRIDQDAARRLSTASGPVTVRTSSGDTVRVLALPLPSVGVVVFGESTREVSSTLGKLLGLELIGGAVAVAGTAALGTVGVRVGLRPLDRVTRTARTVAAELSPDGAGLDRRVPDSDPGTEVGQLAEAVNTMLDAVEREYSARRESEQRMRRFLADASHELRTPLTSLRGYAELIRLRGGDGFGAEARDSLLRIESEGTRMSRLVDDLLTLARSDRGVAVERVPVDLAEVVRDAVADLRAAHPQREVGLDAVDPLPVLGDRDQLVQAVSNVLNNAAVHATAGGPVTVSAGRDGAEVVVTVADTGPGMRPDQVAYAFERFWRADAARTRVRGGSGLGLSIVYALVTDHGGRVSLDSAVETGTTVRLRLPAR